LKYQKKDSKLIPAFRKVEVNMINRELLKKEIDNVQDEYLVPLYKIIKTFEQTEKFSNIGAERPPGKNKKAEWRGFVKKFAGSLADSPIERGEQGIFEGREEIE
jgi:hypothetical protein